MKTREVLGSIIAAPRRPTRDGCTLSYYIANATIMIASLLLVCGGVEGGADKRSPPPLLIWLDRHVPRTGGRSTASFMARLRRSGLVLHREALILGGSAAYAHPTTEFRRLVQAARICRSSDGGSAPAGTAESTVLAVQSADDETLQTWLEEVRALRNATSRDRYGGRTDGRASAACAGVLLSARVRSPLEYYLSSYLHACHPDMKPSRGIGKVKWRETSEGHAVYHTPSFAEWSRDAHNLQSRSLLYGGGDAYLVGEIPSARWSREPAPMTEAAFARLTSALETDFDVVTPLSRRGGLDHGGESGSEGESWPLFASGLRRIVRKLRLSDGGGSGGSSRGASAIRTAMDAARRVRISPKRPFYGGGLRAHARAQAIREACPNMSVCEALIMEVAPFDWRLYQLALTLWRHVSDDAALASAAESTRTSPTDIPKVESSVRTSYTGGEAAAAESDLGFHLSSRCAPADLIGPILPAVAQASCSRLRAATSLPPSLLSAVLNFSAACASTVAVGGMYTSASGRQPTANQAEMTDDSNRYVRVHDRHNEIGSAVDDVHVAILGMPSAGDAPGANVRTAPRPPAAAAPSVAACPSLLLWPSLLQIPQPSDVQCTEVRLSFAFTSAAVARTREARGKPPIPMPLPYVPKSQCNIVLTDNATAFYRKAGQNWTMRRVLEWPWPDDMHRSTHVMKVAAPLLFPFAKTILWADIKCIDSRHRLPCAAYRPSEESDLVVPMNRWFYGRSVEGEFIASWEHLRGRRHTPSHVFHDFTAELSAQEGKRLLDGALYDLQKIKVVPDIFCMGWRNTAASRAFACAWAQRVASASMREQLSFDFARRAAAPALRIKWAQTPFFSTPKAPGGTGRDGWQCTAPSVSSASAPAG